MTHASHPLPAPSSCAPRSLGWPSLVDDWGRWLLRTYFLGSIMTMVSYSLLTLVTDFPGPYPVALFLAAVGVPLVFVTVGLVLRLRARAEGRLHIEPVDPDAPPGLLGNLSQMRWLLATIAMFGAWPGFYFVASKLGGLQEPVVFHFRVDSEIPRITALAPVYSTIYWFFIFPALYGRDPRHFRALLGSYAALMVICSAVFIAYPVIYPREPLVVHTLGDWALAIVQGADPPTNCFPSSHCAVATLSALALREIRPSAFPAAMALALAIVVGTVLTKQHYLVDSVAGVALGVGAWAGTFHAGLTERVRTALGARA